MILIITHKEDFTADFVIQKLNERNIPFFRFNCEDMLIYDITISSSPQISYSINSFSQFSAVWYRRTKIPEINAENLPEKLYLLEENRSFLKNLLSIIRGKWLSNPDMVARAENKMLQLQLALECGFEIPPTIVATNKKTAALFFKKYRPAIIKPLNRSRIQYSETDAGLIFASEISPTMEVHFNEFELTPAIFQQKLEKEYELRVTVVGDKIFAAKVDSQMKPESATDWRRGDANFTAYELPVNIAEACRLLLKKLSINFGAFDLVKKPKGGYIFLEVNPNGQWVWIEQQTGLPIADAIIEFLTSNLNSNYNG